MAVLVSFVRVVQMGAHYLLGLRLPEALAAIFRELQYQVVEPTQVEVEQMALLLVLLRLEILVVVVELMLLVRVARQAHLVRVQAVLALVLEQLLEILARPAAPVLSW